MFKDIKTQEDIKEFLENTNFLHDGYIVSAEYAHNGISKIENGHSVSPWMTTLRLRVLVTSIWDAVVEIKFEGLDGWQIKEDSLSAILLTTLSFDDHGRIVWAGDVWQDLEELKSCSYVIASSMKWRMIK